VSRRIGTGISLVTGQIFTGSPSPAIVAMTSA
jgi:hypothetical protein